MIKAGHANIGLTNILRPECRNRKRGAMPPRCCSAEIERISGTATSIVIRVQRGRAARPLCTRIKGAERNKGLTYKRWWYHAVTRQCTAVAVGLGGHIWVTRSNSFGSSMGRSGRALLSKRRMRDQPGYRSHSSSHTTEHLDSFTDSRHMVAPPVVEDIFEKGGRSTGGSRSEGLSSRQKKAAAVVRFGSSTHRMAEPVLRASPPRDRRVLSTGGRGARCTEVMVSGWRPWSALTQGALLRGASAGLDPQDHACEVQLNQSATRARAQ